MINHYGDEVLKVFAVDRAGGASAYVESRDARTGSGWSLSRVRGAIGPEIWPSDRAASCR